MSLAQSILEFNITREGRVTFSLQLGEWQITATGNRPQAHSRVHIRHRARGCHSNSLCTTICDCGQSQSKAISALTIDFHQNIILTLRLFLRTI